MYVGLSFILLTLVTKARSPSRLLLDNKPNPLTGYSFPNWALWAYMVGQNKSLVKVHSAQLSSLSFLSVCVYESVEV